MNTRIQLTITVTSDKPPTDVAALAAAAVDTVPGVSDVTVRATTEVS